MSESLQRSHLVGVLRRVQLAKSGYVKRVHASGGSPQGPLPDLPKAVGRIGWLGRDFSGAAVFPAEVLDRREASARSPCSCEAAAVPCLLSGL